MVTTTIACRCAATHLQRIIAIMPRLAERLEPCTQALQDASTLVSARTLVDHPKHAVLADQLQRIAAFCQVPAMQHRRVPV